MFLIKNQKGVSLVYVLMALVCVGAMGMLVLSMAKKEKSDSSLRISSELSRYAANAGLIYAVNYFSNPVSESSALTLLKYWHEKYKKGEINKITNGSPQKWLVGDAAEFVSKDGMRFRTKIINIDFSNLKKITGKSDRNRRDSKVLIMLECESIDKSGSRAKSCGSYAIYGYEIDEMSNALPQNALYMGSGADEINVVVDVDGATFLRGGGFLHHSGHIFGNPTTGGEFRRHGTGDGFILKNSVFNGPAYFGEEVGQNGATKMKLETGRSIFKRGFGCESFIFSTGQSDPDIYFGAFLNNGYSTQNYNGGWIFQPQAKLRGLSGQTYTSGSGSGIEKLYSWSGVAVAPTTPATLEYTKMNILDSLSMPKDPPPSISIDYSLIEPYIYNLTSINGKRKAVDGDDLNELYKNYFGQKYNNEWMIIRFQPDGVPFNSGGINGFSGKMILLIDNKLSASGFGTQFYKSANNGVSLIVVENGVKADQLGNNALIRGLVVNLGSGNLDLQSSGKNMTVRGAVYCVGSGKLRLEGGENNKIKFVYDRSVLEEIAELGVVIVDGVKEVKEGLIERIKQEVIDGLPVSSELLGRSF
ncbi:MAG: hypothetical protein FWF51_00750 [Chitinivibrionia bacterium]|nr:hypothetical protein [Chitinivibrionia bacterium]